MITIPASDLRGRVAEVFGAADCPQAVAQRVAASLVENNLTGHDSHGVIRVPYYVRCVQEGRVNPRAELRVVRESATTAVLDCGHNFGQVAAKQGMELAIAKAREHDIAIVALQDCTHGPVGRVRGHGRRAGDDGPDGL